MKIEIELRPCYVKGVKALFHKWVKSTDVLMHPFTKGIVEYEDGSIDMVSPYSIKFCDNKLNEYAFPEREE